jgi:hypothetical protein
VIHALVVLVTAGILTASNVPTPFGASSSSRVNTPASASRTSSPSPTTADCPATITNISGSYKFECTAGWQYLNCESSDVNGAFTWLINPNVCGPKTTGARMMVWTLPGDVTATHESNVDPMMYVGTRQSSRNVTVDGIIGTRRTYLVNKTLASGPPKGTIQILYMFVTGGETHLAQYDRYPKEVNLTTAFDRMIITTLSFSP